MLNRGIFKVSSILLFGLAFLLGSVSVPFLSGASATATQPPGYGLQVRNVSDGGTFEGAANSVNLDTGEIAQMRMQVNDLNVGNDINSLRFKAFFNDLPNPTKFDAAVKADELNWIGGEVSVQVPGGFYLQYVPGSTVFDVDDRPEFQTRTQVPDINGTTPLAFANGYELTNIQGGPHTWIWMYFKVQAVASQPVVINPRLDLEKVVANASKGETLSQKRTETTVGPGDTAVFQITVKNGVAESTLHNVVLKDQQPAGSATPQVLVANATSTEKSDQKQIKVNITNSMEINVIAGSVVLKDKFGNTIKTLSDEEVSKLFGGGLSLGDIHGTFEYAQVIEYKAKVSQILPLPPTPVLPNTGSGAILLLLSGSVPVGLALRRLKVKI